MGRIDRALRFLAGIVLLYICLIDDSPIHIDIIRYLLIVFACANVVSAIISFCPMYIFAGINTQKTASK